LAGVEPAFRRIGVEFESGFQGIQGALRIPFDVAQGGEDVERFRLHGVGLDQEINQGGGFGPEVLLDFGELDIGPCDVGLFLHRHLVRGKGNPHVTSGAVRVPLSGQDVGPFKVQPAVFRTGQGLLKSGFGLLLTAQARQNAGALEGGLHHIWEIRFQLDEGLQTRLDIAGRHMEPVSVKVPFGVRAPFPFEHVHHVQRSGQVALCGAEVEQSACGEVVFRLVLQEPLEGVVGLGVEAEFQGDFGQLLPVPGVGPIQCVGFEDGGMGARPVFGFPLQSGEFIVDRGFRRVGIETGQQGFLGPRPVPFELGDLRVVECLVEGLIDPAHARVSPFFRPTEHGASGQDQREDTGPSGSGQTGSAGGEPHSISQ